jgi:biotin synthase
MTLAIKDWPLIFQSEWGDFWPWLAEANRVREAHFGRRVSFCVIINAKSGLCSEDCAFCSQSRVSRAEIPRYPLLSREKLMEGAQAAAAAGAARFSLVTSGRDIGTSREKEVILEAVAAIRERVGIKVCASLGLADRVFLEELKAAGLSRYHHNLETARSYYPKICTTHRYEERLATVAAAKAAGLEICVGGIFGLGETLRQRQEMAQTLKELDPDAIPLNFLHPLPGTRLAEQPLLPPLEALQIIAAFRLSFPEKTLIICGGRLPTLRSLGPLMFVAGANALMTGDYLTTKGRLPEADREMVQDLGLELEGVCGQNRRISGPTGITQKG